MSKKSAPKSTIAQVKQELAALSHPERAANLAWFFKTGKGEYGEGDQFLGITVPLQRKIASRHLIGKVLLAFISAIQRGSITGIWSTPQLSLHSW